MYYYYYLQVKLSHSFMLGELNLQVVRRFQGGNSSLNRRVCFEKLPLACDWVPYTCNVPHREHILHESNSSDGNVGGGCH